MFATLLDTYLRHCKEYRPFLARQVFALRQIEKIARKVKEEGHSKAEREIILKHGLKEAAFPDRFQLPVSPEMEVSHVIIEKCKVRCIVL